MLNEPRYYHGLIKKYVQLVGSIFNDIYIERTSASGQSLALIKVPISYSTKDKMLARIMQDPELDRPYSALLPRISFELIGGMHYDGDRHLNTTTRKAVKIAGNPNSLKYQYNPVPYNISFRVTVFVKNAEDATKIVEQILPKFTPDWTQTVELIPELGISHDIPVTIQNPTIDDQYDTDFKVRRVLTWDFDVTVRGYLYGPIKQKKIIKFATTNIRVGEPSDNEGSPPIMLTVSPGLTANGEPTSDSSQTVDPNVIYIDDDFGFVEEWVIE